MKTDYLKSQLDRHQTIERQMRWLTLAWRRSHRLLSLAVAAGELAAGLPTATPEQQEVWRCFRSNHDLRQIARVLQLLEERDLSLADFVAVWQATTSYPTTLQILWSRPSATRRPPDTEAHAA